MIINDCNTTYISFIYLGSNSTFIIFAAAEKVRIIICIYQRENCNIHGGNDSIIVWQYMTVNYIITDAVLTSTQVKL